MKAPKISRRHLLALTVFLLGALGLAACGESEPTLPPLAAALSPTGAVATNGSTPVVTLNTTTQAANTATAVITTSPAPPIETPGAAGPLMELLRLIPDSPDNLHQLTFNDYAALRKVYGIPDNQTYLQYSKSDQGASAKLISMTRHLNH